MSIAFSKNVSRLVHDPSGVSIAEVVGEVKKASIIPLDVTVYGSVPVPTDEELEQLLVAHREHLGLPPIEPEPEPEPAAEEESADQQQVLAEARESADAEDLAKLEAWTAPPPDVGVDGEPSAELVKALESLKPAAEEASADAVDPSTVGVPEE